METLSGQAYRVVDEHCAIQETTDPPSPPKGPSGVSASTPPVLCIDVGSAFTKAVLVDLDSAGLLAAACLPSLPGSSSGSAEQTSRPTRAGGVTDTIAAARRDVIEIAGLAPDALPADSLLVCSSLGGGLRVAVVAQDEAACATLRRSLLGTGAIVVHVHGGELDWPGLTALKASQPDVIVMIGGDAELIQRQSRRLAGDKRPVPVLMACARQIGDSGAGPLHGRGRTVKLVEPTPAGSDDRMGPLRLALRDMFERHVIGARSQLRSRLDDIPFSRLVRSSSPQALRSGVDRLAAATGDVLVVDVGASTTQVISLLGGGRDPDVHHTVEADLGLRLSASALVAAAQAEGLVDGPFDAVRATGRELSDYADVVSVLPALVPLGGQAPLDVEVQLAAVAARVAVRRHGRASRPGRPGRPLAHLRLLVGRGGTLRHGDEATRLAILGPLTSDHGGGWEVPDSARLAVDASGVLCAAGLIAQDHPEVAAALAANAVSGQVPA